MNSLTLLGSRLPSQPAEHCTGHQAGSARVTKVEQAPKHFTGGIKTLYGLAAAVHDAGRRRLYRDTSEGESNPTANLVGLERSLINGLSPV